MAPKKKKKEEVPVVEVVEEPPVVEEESEVEEVQFTETSYTSASFESLPPLPPVVDDHKKKKKKKAKEEEVVERVPSDLIIWSEDSLPPFVEEEAKDEQAKEQAEKVKGGGKKKKGKKGQQEDIPEFEKPKNWKKMNAKEREKWMNERIEEWRAEVEAEKQAKIAGAKEKRIREQKERQARLVQDIDQQEIRRDILKKTCQLFHKYETQKKNYERKKQAEAEWALYLRCDGLPDPAIVTQMATYLSRWKESAKYDVDELDQKCVEVLPLLEMLDLITAQSARFTARQNANYNEVRLQLREQLATAIEFASYFVLRNIEKNLTYESIKIANYHRTFHGLKLNIWCAIKMPTLHVDKVKEKKSSSMAALVSKTNLESRTKLSARKSKSKSMLALIEAQLSTKPPPVELAFPGIKVKVVLPSIVDGRDLCVRASRSLIDLLSERTRSFALARELANVNMDLFTYNENELRDIIKLKSEQDAIRNAFYKRVRDRTRELENFIKANVFLKNEEEKKELEDLALSEPPFMPDPRTFFAESNEKAFNKYLKLCLPRNRVGEINLRKYRICGGTLNLDLLTTPPQPKKMEYGLFITTLRLPKALKALDYKVQYRAPPPPGPGSMRTPEMYEAQLKQIEAEYEKLAQVFIELPAEIMWQEPPVVCQWQEKRNLWTTNYINDYRYNEEKLTLQFRTGVLWPIGIAVLKYSNLPYQGWDIRPDPKSKGVFVVVTGVNVTVTWLCIGNKVKLKFIANTTSRALKDHYNKKMPVKKMVQVMREAGCDFFPDFDAHNYLEGTCPKDWVMEQHSYHAMAFMSRAHNFQWSRWNAQAGSRNIIMQFREAIDKKREAKLCLMRITTEMASLLKNNEMSMNELDLEPPPAFPFFPDLFTYNMTYGSIDARRATFGMKYELVETVYDLLRELKLFSFS